MSWVDRVAEAVSPQWHQQRVRARLHTEFLRRRYEAAGALLQRHYEGAADSRRTQHWYRRQTDANTAIGPSLAKLRDAARDLVRNNPYARSALATIVNNAVGWGIVPTAKDDRFEAWSTSTACDADGRLDLAGLQKLVTRTMAESGEVLVRRRWRRPEDGLPLPFQLQVLEPDFLDVGKEGALPGGGRIIQGVEFDGIGRRVAYWLFAEHPGSSLQFGGSIFSGSHRVPAHEVAPVYAQERAGQVHGVTWFASALLRFYDLADAEDANLLKQKIAACLGVIFTDPEGVPGPVGQEGEPAVPAGGEAKKDALDVDVLHPGMIINAPAGRQVSVVEPPRVTEFAEYSKSVLRGNAAGVGVSYEDMTGDFQQLSFSAARMSFLRHRPAVEDTQWRILIPQFLDHVWGWAVEAAALQGGPAMPARTRWTPPPAPMVDPEKEGLAAARNVRGGLQTHFEIIRERGHEPDVFLREYKKGLDALDELGIILDSDVRYVTHQGQAQSKSATPEGSAKIASERGMDQAAELLARMPPERAAYLFRKLYE